MFAEDAVKHPFFAWINQQEGPRPEYVWQGAEDLIYHNRGFANKNWENAPEFYAFLSKNWVFNKQMEWIRTDNGNIICYSKGNYLALTGDGQASKWFSDPANSIRNNNDYTVFEKKSTIRTRDAAVLPAFQFQIDQHPILELEVDYADCDWQFCVAVKGRAGIPLLSSGWCNKAKKIKLNLAEALQKKGYKLNYPELTFVMGVWTNSPEKSGKVSFKAGFPTHPAIIASLPVIKTLSNANRGISIESITVNGQGIPMQNANTVICKINGNKLFMQKHGQGYITKLPIYEEGSYSESFEADSFKSVNYIDAIRITRDEYYKYDKTLKSITLNAKPISPLTGSYQGTVYFAGNGTSKESIVQGQEEWDKHIPEDLRLHWWESLTEKELKERFSYLQSNGWKVLHLNTHWNNWERLDAGGKIAPHAAEQLALYIRTAAEYGLCHIQDLSHYPYYESEVWQEYLDNGYKNEYWFIPGKDMMPGKKTFTTMFNQYIHDFATIFKDETNILAIGASGEGDRANQLSRSVSIMKAFKEIDKKHLFIAEPSYYFYEMPQMEVLGWSQDLLGSRTYLLGNRMNTELDMGVYFRLHSMVPNMCMLEGSFPAPPVYARMTYGPNDERSKSWIGTDMYRSNLRLSIYMGLLYRLPLLVTWDEQVTEDERIVFEKIRNEIHWDSPLEDPEISLYITDSFFQGNNRIVGGEYEHFFTTKYPRSYKFISEKENANGYIIDVNDKYSEPHVPDSIAKLFSISDGYAVSYTQTADKRQILAFVFNVGSHKRYEVEYANNHRIAIPENLKITTDILHNYSCEIFSLNSKKIIYSGMMNKVIYEKANTDDDYFIVLNKL